MKLNKKYLTMSETKSKIGAGVITGDGVQEIFKVAKAFCLISSIFSKEKSSSNFSIHIDFS
mgnify:CR=1 FL=1